MNDSTTFVYFISAGSTPIKIGISGDPLTRLKDLQTAHYQRLQLLYTIECAERSHALELESAFHRWYDEKQLLNEWYSLTPKRLAADIHLLTTLAKVFVRVEQFVSVELIERMEARAELKLSPRNRSSRKMNDALGWLRRHPEHLETESRELTQHIGASHVTIWKAQQLLKGSHTVNGNGSA